jgi:hypothetical protein
LGVPSRTLRHISLGRGFGDDRNRARMAFGRHSRGTQKPGYDV